MKPDEARFPKQTTRQTINLERVYPHSPQRVWQALTDPQALGQWLLPTTFKPRLGHRFRFTCRSVEGKPEKVRCQVVELDAPCRLAYTWQVEGEDVPTLVTWTLEPVEEGTCLRLEHIGPTTSCALNACRQPGLQASGGEPAEFVSSGFPRLCLDTDSTARALPSACSHRAHPAVTVGRIVLNNQTHPLRCVSRLARVARRTGSSHEEVSPCTR